MEEYLSYYVGQQSPGYAVLITGPWGSGKTYQVRRALPDTHAYYISLFGLDTSDAIHASIFAAMHPGKAALKNIAEKLDEVEGAGFKTGGILSGLANHFIKNEIDKSKPIIFDDLERSSIPIMALLGLINHYVEHHKCRIIVIAHTAMADDYLTLAKEKIFGQSIEITPNLEAAFSTFAAQFHKADAPPQLTDLQKEILPIFRDSRVRSLRILRHVVEDVGRLVSVLDQAHLEHRDASVATVRLFSALAIESRDGSLSREDIEKRQEKIIHYLINPMRSGEPAMPKLLTLSEKYKTTSFRSELLDDKLLVSMLFDGIFDKTAIRAALDNSTYFLKPEESRPWQLVINFEELDDEVVAEAIKRMNEQFDNREITESGEFLHVVALKMLHALEGISGETIAEVRDKSIAYLDDMLSRGRLPPRSSGTDWVEEFNGSYARHTYWVVQEKYGNEFNQVFDHLKKCRREAYRMTVREEVESLLSVVRANGETAFELLCYTNKGPLKYEDVPILAFVPVQEFIDAWLSSPRSGWHWITNALKERYRAAARYSELAPEREWCVQVINRLKEIAEDMDPISRFRIERQIGFSSILQDLKAEAS